MDCKTSFFKFSMSSKGENFKQEGDFVRKDMRAVSVGNFTDMFGNKINITPDLIESMVANFKDPIPVKVDHKFSAWDIIGLADKPEIKGDQLYLVGEIRKPEAVEMVKLGLWQSISPGIEVLEFSNGKREAKLLEISVVSEGANENARLLAKNKKNDQEGGLSVSDTLTPELKVFKQEYEIRLSKMQEEHQKSSEIMQNSIKALVSQNEELRKQMQAEKDREVIKSFVRMGKIPPAMEESEFKIYSALPSDELKTEWKKSTEQRISIRLGSIDSSAEAIDEVKRKEEVETAYRLAGKKYPGK